MVFRLLALALALTPAAHAETYKWVDEKGVVNYGNAPPPSAAGKSMKTVAERVSSYEPDPALKQAIARGLSPYELMAHEEWLQRQRLMAQAQLLQATRYPPPAAGAYPYYPYYGAPVVVGRAVRPTRHFRTRR